MHRRPGFSGSRACQVLNCVIRRGYSSPSLLRHSVSHEEYHTIEKHTKYLVDLAARGPEFGWKLPKTLRGEEKHLVNLVGSFSGQKGSISNQDNSRDTLSEADDDLTVIPSLGPADERIPPGTFVELRRSGSLTHGVALDEQFVDRIWQVLILTSTGKLQMHPKTEVTFLIPALASTTLTCRCGISEVARTQKEIMARVEVLKRIREIEKAVEVSCTSVIQKVRAIYSHVKSPDPRQWSQVTLAEAVKLVQPESESSLITVFAVHKQLMLLNKEFSPEFFCYRASQSFDVRPQLHVDTINAITAMSRITDGPLDAFAKKVRRVTSSNRKRFIGSWDEPPSFQQSDRPVFDADDRVIINFILHSLDRRTVTQLDPYKLGLSSILKKLDAYDGLVDVSLIYQVLIDIGVFPPWQDLFSRLREYDLYQGPLESSPKMIEQEALVRRAFSAEEPSRHQSREGFYLHDPAESIRHDFGDMAAYVIDDAGAEELDDGISFESIPSEPESAWVHVHIADPTSVLPPDHPISQHAREQGETAYFLHRTWPMLPQSLVQEKLSLCSIGPKLPLRVLTFSFKVDSKGDIVDYKVRPGLIRNIHRLYYDAVDLAMGWETPRKEFPFGMPEITLPPPVPIEQTVLRDIRGLDKVADRLVAARLRLPTFIQSAPTIMMCLSPRPLVSHPFDFTKPSLYRGFPHITYSLSTVKDLDVGSRRLVSELMKATCRVASRFCLDHDVPVLRRTARRLITKTESDFEELLSMRDSRGYVDWMEAVSREVVTPAAEFTLEPKMHWGLGIPDGEGYVRVTSPLRRYDDMASHWQIKHALLGSKGKPPFSAQLLLESGRAKALRETRRKQTMRCHEKFWALIFVERWMKGTRQRGDGVDPLADLIGISMTTPNLDMKTRRYFCLVRLPKLGLNAVLDGLTRADIPVGVEMPVKIAAVKLGLIPQLKVVSR